MLDVAIHISLCYLELQLYDEVIFSERPMVNPMLADKISKGEWRDIIIRTGRGQGPNHPEIDKYLGQIDELESIQKQYDKDTDFSSQKFANNKRRGLRVTTYSYCQQYEEYCKGFFFHNHGMVDQAIQHYSKSLMLGGKYSQNCLRKSALEAIELIVKEKRSYYHKSRHPMYRQWADVYRDVIYRQL